MHTLRYTFATRLAEQNFTEDSGTSILVSTMRYSRTLEGQKDKAVDVLDAEKTNGCTQTAKNFTSPNNKKAEKASNFGWWHVLTKRYFRKFYQLSETSAYSSRSMSITYSFSVGGRWS